MTYTVGVVMDPIAKIKPEKDTSFAMMLEAQHRGATLIYLELKDLYIDNGVPKAIGYPVTVRDQAQDFYTLGEEQQYLLGELDVILMRKDPPFDSEFLYATHILDLAERAGALVVNKPQSLRDFNEKLFTAYFPELIPDTLVTRNAALVRQFHAKHKDVICKPLDGMGGASIFRIKEDGTNLGVIIETLTSNGQSQMMVQAYLPAIKEGDKRVLIVNGKVMPYCLARLPSAGETRGNLAAGGTGRPQPISDSDRALAETIAPVLVERGLMFVGLDVIGDRITEINVTSPTCVREIERAYDINITGELFDAIEAKLN
ncbi:MAG TPA: glutathione synthase [Alteromonas sp.]|jgi:glutathione synthase|nr:glutathione synthase [Alteromonas sp.]HCA76782.1 glutathione synthase [Alteromonas sp.]HCB08894.1 glutathione synthase [Alteromonas sp.]HCB16936.1 glutathione synthase [Alteromonas sp.]HCL12603.1 glutathione synthase [Alteromonas sp.]|tara:strand:+ start:2867 stop:3814 length:948 start_codon:yes stop_codon:yes gene_type:complete